MLTVALLVLSGCERDLSVPDGPQRGSLKGAVDTAGHLLPSGQEVVLVSEAGSSLEQTTGPDGAFVFGDLAPGLYYLQLELPGFAPLTRPNLRVKIGAELDVGTLAPAWLGAGSEKEATLVGKVAAGGGGDVNGARVEFVLQAANETIATSTVGVDGTFVQRLPPGLYSLRAVHPNYTVATAADVQLAVGERKDITSTPLVMDINPATLSGSVLREVDRQPAVAADTVTVTLGNGQTTQTDSSGNFTITSLPAGAQTIRFTLGGHHDTTVARTVTLEAGKTTAYPQVTLMLDRGDLSGTVVLSDGRPATDIQVRVTGTPYGTTATPTAADPSRASFFISGVPVGTNYQLSATRTSTEAPAYIPAVRTGLPVTQDAVTNVTPELSLTAMSGAISVDDGVATNDPGFTTTTGVSLVASNLSSAATYRASEDPTFAGVSFATLPTGNIPFTLSSTQGLHTVYFQYRDAAQTTSHTLSATVVLDSVPPSSPVAAIEGGADFTNKPATLTVTISSTDATSGVSALRINETGASTSGVLTATAQPYAQTLVYTRAGTTDGLQTLHVQVFDRAGNASPISTDTITVDSAAPTGTFSIRRGPLATVDGYTNTTLVELNLQAAAEPNGGFLRMKRANAASDLATAVYEQFNPAANHFLASGTEGSRTVYVQLQDAAGNTSNVLNASIIYDKTPPPSVSASSPAFAKSSPISVTVSATDDLLMSPTQAVTVSEDVFFAPSANTVGPSPLTSQVSFPLTTDGQKRIYVRFRDAAGNDAQVNFPVTLDTVAPTLRAFDVVGTLADGTSSTSVTFTPSVTLRIDQTGATSYLASNTTLATCPATGYSNLTGPTVSHLLTGSGARSVALCLRDDAGNTTGPVSANIVVDTAGPTGCQLVLVGARADGPGAAPAEKTALKAVTHTFSGCFETPTEIYFTENPTACPAANSFGWQTYSAGMTIGLSDGDAIKTVRGCVRDAARNTASFQADTIELDTAAPTNPRISLNGGAAFVNGNDVTANGYSVNVTGSANGAVSWALSESSPVSTSYSPIGGGSQTFPFTPATGERTVYARFKDDVGNASVEASDSIVFDITSPDSSTAVFGINSPTGNGFTNSRTVAVTLGFLTTAQAADVAGVLLAQAASASGCVNSDFTGVAATPRFASAAYVLTGNDGPKLLCLRLLDAAGNESATVSATINLDTRPPTAPIISTPSQYVAVTNPLAQPFTVNLSTPVGESNFARYDIANTDFNWTQASTNISTTAFTYTLNTSTAATGAVNILRIRAVDVAGNESQSSVTIINDTVAPAAPTVNPTWIDNRAGRATFYWQASTSSDVTRYEVDYGAATDSYTGQFAFEGASPINVGTATSFGLSGLVNATATYVRVASVDRAGNRTQSAQITLEPNSVSPNLLGNSGTQLFGTQAGVKDMQVHGDLLYLTATDANSCGNGRAHLRIMDLSTIASPLRGGAIVPAQLPTLIGQLDFAEPLDCVQWGNGTMNLAVEWPWAFMGIRNKLHIINIMNPATPTIVAQIDLGFPLFNPVVRGRRLFVSGAPNRIFALDLSKLYDNDVTTIPDATDLIGTVTTGASQPQSLVLSRYFLIQTDFNGDATYTYSAYHALDDPSAGTVWDNADQIGSSNLGFMGFYRGALTSGNFLFTFSSSSLRLHNLNPLFNSNVVPQPSNRIFDLPELGSSSRGLSVVASEYFSFDNSTNFLTSFDISNVLAPTPQSFNRLGTSYDGIATYGPFLFGPRFSGMNVHELAHPDTSRIRARKPGLATPGILSGGFWNGNATTFDLQDPNQTMVQAVSAVDNVTPLSMCAFDQARFEPDRMVQARGTVLTTWRNDRAVDRDATTNFTNLDIASHYALPAGTTAKAIKAAGNFAIVVEEKADGMYFEVFDTHRIRNNNPGTAVGLTAADSRGTYKFTTMLGRPALAFKNGRAFVGLETTAPTAGGNFFSVDLRNMLDDDASVMEAYDAPGQVTVQGPVPLPVAAQFPDQFAIRNVVVQGNYAYIGGPTGLTIFNVSAALDNDPATTLPTTPLTVSLPTFWSSGFNRAAVSGLAVYGGYAFVTLGHASTGSNEPNDLLAIDVANPAAPVVLSRVVIRSGRRTCDIGSFTNVEMRDSIVVSGSRAYVGYGSELYVIDLE